MSVTLGLGLGLPAVKRNASGFNPASLNPLWWFKSYVGTFQTPAGAPAVANSDPIGSWLDQSGNSRDLTQLTGSLRPTIKLLIQNGLPAVRFDGVDDFMSLILAMNQPTQIVAVMQQKSWTLGGSLWDGTGTNQLRGYQFGGTPGMALYAGGGSQGPANADLGIGTVGIVEMLYSGLSSTVIVNGGTPVTETDPGTSAATGFTLGASAGGAAAGNVDIGELFGFSPPVSGVGLSNLRSYLRTTWAIP